LPAGGHPSIGEGVLDLNCPKDLSPIFQPRSIALVGVPRGFEPGKVFLQGLLDQGYPGKIFPVNPRADFIDGLRSYPSVKEIPEDIDLAILLVPAPLVLPALEQCGEKKVRAAVIYSSGFAETGDGEGKKREEEILRVASNYGISLIGPNCMGIYDPNHRLAFFPGLPGRGGFISARSSAVEMRAT
jgi:acyl-CoA synthetase (NDP forming)